MTYTTSWAIPVGVVLGSPIALYTAFLLLGSIPFFQRHFLYAYKLNTLFYHDLNLTEYWGFAKNQVTPFSLITEDNCTLYAWHILPLQAYLKNETTLQAEPRVGFARDITKTESFKILRDDPEARLVISFHGNAGHIAQAIRPSHIHALTDTSPYHVLTLDYRGFGHSTGSPPTEKGLLIDAITAVNWAVEVAGIPPSRIVLLGQSLGTAVTASVAAHFSSPSPSHPADYPPFAGIILIAGFSSLPNLLAYYQAGGVIPVLSPFRIFCPPLLRLFQTFIVDRWPSAHRLAGIVIRSRCHSSSQNQNQNSNDNNNKRGKRLRLTIIHAQNDREIPCHQSDELFRFAARAALRPIPAAVTAAENEDGEEENIDMCFDEDGQYSASAASSGETGNGNRTREQLEREELDRFLAWKKTVTTRREDGTYVAVVEAEPDVVIRQEIVPYGGHNNVMHSSAVALAVMRSFQ